MKNTGSQKYTANVVGAGLAGLSAAITLARLDIPVRLISLLPSERSQSVLAEGGINGALDTMGEDDSTDQHFADTMKAGVYIADREAVKGLTENAPQILMELKKLGVPFNLRDEQIEQRSFGGQKKKRTAYARSSTGKVLMTALIDEARRYETEGLIQRFSHHELTEIIIIGNGGSCPADDSRKCVGIKVVDKYTGKSLSFMGPVILATGGMNGIFPEITTGTVTNSGDASALAFKSGVIFSNLEMIQYHPTTIGIAGKRCLISEAARGEGGRLFVIRDEKPWYFMEEKYPELGNLMPRDVVSREMYFISREIPGGIFLDMRGLSKEIWEKKLPDLRMEIIHYLGIDPKVTPVPVEPGIHYFMGGIDVDAGHHTNIKGLYAAGECCSQYHGANRLGGNSTIGAIYGGRVAAQSLSQEGCVNYPGEGAKESGDNVLFENNPADCGLVKEIRDILTGALGIVRNGHDIEKSISDLEDLKTKVIRGPKEEARLLLAEAMLRSASFRKESRGAHYRSDYPETLDEYKGKTLAFLNSICKPEIIFSRQD